MLKTIFVRAASHTVNEEVRLHVPRIRAFYYLLCVTAIVYFALNMALLHQYATYEAPFSLFAMHVPQVNFSDSIRKSSRTMCNNPAYPIAIPRDNVSLSSVPCFEVHDIHRLTDMRVSDADFFSFMGEQSLDTCIYYNCSAAFYPVGVEDIPIEFRVGIWTTAFGSQVDPTITVQSKTPGHYLHNKRYAAGRQDSFLVYTLSDLLMLAGVRLTDINSIPNYVTAPYRFTGIKLIMSFEFSNMRAWDPDTTLQAILRVEAVPSVFGNSITRTAASLLHPGTDVRLVTNAVTLLSQSRGIIGSMDITRVVSSFTSLVVLLGLAKTITDVLINVYGREKLVPVEKLDPPPPPNEPIQIMAT